MSQMLDVITYGEAMAMFVATAPGPLAQATQFTKRIAGADLNVAVGLSRLGFRVGYVSRVGQDSFGEYVLETLARERIDASCVTVDRQCPTGFQLKSRADDGSDPRVEYFRKGSAASRLSCADYVADYVLGARHLHLTGVAPAISASSVSLREGNARGGWLDLVRSESATHAVAVRCRDGAHAERAGGAFRLGAAWLGRGAETDRL